jgi:hypothetical protein
MPAGAQLVGERANAVGEALGVMEEEDVRDRPTVAPGAASGRYATTAKAGTAVARGRRRRAARRARSRIREARRLGMPAGCQATAGPPVRRTGRDEAG